MDPKTTLTFLEDAENKLCAIRRGILVGRQEGGASGLEEQLREVRSLKAAADALGFGPICNVLEALDIESARVFSEGAPLTDENSRTLLDMLANAEAEIVKSRIETEDNSMNVTDFVDSSFEFLQFNTAKNQPRNEVANLPTANEKVDDEFEIDAEMLEIFAVEAEDLLGSIESHLDTLAAGPDNREALWEIRRHAHTFKGAAGIVGLKTPSQLAHRVEDLLDHLALNEIGPDSRILKLLSLSTTCLRSITGGDTSPATSDLVNEVYRGFDDVMAVFAEPTAGPLKEVQCVAGESIPTAPVSSPESQTVQARPIVRVSIARLDEIVRIVRDLVVNRSAVEQRMLDFEQQIEELHGITRRLQATSAKIETDFEASMLGTQQVVSFGNGSGSREYESAAAGGGEQFDSLELDRYTDFHQSARELTEATSDSFSSNTTLEALKCGLEMVLDDQHRLIEEMLEKVMQIRLIQFGSLATRLQRAVRVTCEEENKKADISIENQEVELDTDVLDSLVEPIMHLLRNAVVHGIESPDTRRLLGKPETGNIVVRVANEETHIVLQVTDDGRGIAGSNLKEKAVSAGLIDAKDAELLNGDQLLDLMFLPGLTTAERLSMSAGRGVGMSIVKESIESRNGTITVETAAQRGTTFTVRIPLAYAVAQVLLVRSDRQIMAIPLKLVQNISEFNQAKVNQSGQDHTLELEAGKLTVKYLADYICVPRHAGDSSEFSTTLHIETGDATYALMVDEIIKSEEVVIKPLGKPLEDVKGVLGAAILGSGSIVPILDLQFLLKNKPPDPKAEAAASVERRTKRVLVVDDSPSVRHMTSKVIASAGWNAITAKDGLEALEFMRSCSELPDVILSDVEMPRMDGYELASALKSDETYREVPIVLITSRSGEKHRDKALDLGISDYLAKPYDDSELISIVKRLSQ